MSQRFIRNRTDYSLLFTAFFLWMQFHISAHICLLQSWEQSPSESVTGDSCRVTVQAGADHAAPAASLTIEIAVWMPFSNPQMVRDGEKLGGGWGWWYHSSQDNPVKVVVSLRRSIIRCCADQPWLNAATWCDDKTGHHAGCRQFGCNSHSSVRVCQQTFVQLWVFISLI